MKDTYTITEVSKMTNLPTSTLRYYENQGLLNHIKRKNNKNRIYFNEDLELIKLIKCFKELGMSLKEIKFFIKKKEKNLISTNKILQEHLIFLKEQKNIIESYIEDIEKKIMKNI